jgi:hypothetical protein
MNVQARYFYRNRTSAEQRLATLEWLGGNLPAFTENAYAPSFSSTPPRKAQKARRGKVSVRTTIMMRPMVDGATASREPAMAETTLPA